MEDVAAKSSSQDRGDHRRRRRRRIAGGGETHAPSQETDGFQLVIDALKLNGIDTIFGLPGIPITDLTRRMQKDGTARDLVPARAERRVCGINRGLPHPEARHLPDRVRARLPQRRDCAHARDGQLLSDDPHQRLLGARDRRSATGRLRGNGPARDRQAAVQGGVPRPACRGHRRGRRAGHPCRRVRPSRRRVPRPAREALSAGHRRDRRQELAHQGRGRSAPADSRAGGRAARGGPPEERASVRSSSSARARPTRRPMPTSVRWSKKRAFPTCRCRWPRASCRTRTSSPLRRRARTCCPRPTS